MRMGFARQQKQTTGLKVESVRIAEGAAYDFSNNSVNIAHALAQSLREGGSTELPGTVVVGLVQDKGNNHAHIPFTYRTTDSDDLDALPMTLKISKAGNNFSCDLEVPAGLQVGQRLDTWMKQAFGSALHAESSSAAASLEASGELQAIRARRTNRSSSRRFTPKTLATLGLAAVGLTALGVVQNRSHQTGVTAQGVTEITQGQFALQQLEKSVNEIRALTPSVMNSMRFDEVHNKIGLNTDAVGEILSSNAYTFSESDKKRAMSLTADYFKALGPVAKNAVVQFGNPTVTGYFSTSSVQVHGASIPHVTPTEGFANGFDLSAGDLYQRYRHFLGQSYMNAFSGTTALASTLDAYEKTVNAGRMEYVTQRLPAAEGFAAKVKAMCLDARAHPDTVELTPALKAFCGPIRTAFEVGTTAQQTQALEALKGMVQLAKADPTMVEPLLYCLPLSYASQNYQMEREGHDGRNSELSAFDPQRYVSSAESFIKDRESGLKK